MRLKIIVIALIAVAVGLLVRQMMRIEQGIREHRQVTLYISDYDIPLIEKAGPRILEEHAAKASYTSRCVGDHIELRQARLSEGTTVYDWTPFFMKGVNLGVAMPGHFPAGFSLDEQGYYYWLTEIAAMNANSVRTYTILPPEFYYAFARYNRDHANKPLYLFQGVWAVVPQEEDYLGEEYMSAFKREIRDALDVLHGNAILPKRPGHAHGVFGADVSAYVGGIILGREWEPVAVSVTNLTNPQRSYRGDFVSVFSATPMEVFLASMMDFTVLYETQEYSWQHPVSFVNWLTLDPMYHNSEFIEGESIREFDNDLETVDIRKFHASNLFVPGIFSSYHVYPYYPDFIYFDEKYGKNPDGHYAAYLAELKAYHMGIPLVIAEYGIPSSRGNSHTTPQGCDQGGHSEAEQAHINARLTRNIWKSGAAGAFYFEWFDEWFKHNWLVMDFEQPSENRVNWHNMENPEQNFGVIALEGRERIVDGEDSDWPGKEDFMSHADPSYFYIAARLPQLDLNTQDLYVGIDTHSESKGDHRLPFGEESVKGLEFLVHIRSISDARLLVDDSYDVYTDILRDLGPPYVSKPNDNGIFVEQKLLSNRIQISLTNDTMPPWEFNRSILQHGRSTDANTSNADWYLNTETGFFEMRFTWLGLNVSDPSTRQVFDDKAGTWIVETSETPGFNLRFYITDKDGRMQESIPSKAYHFASWEPWTTPRYTSRRKVLFDSLAHTYSQCREPVTINRPTGGKGAEVAPFYHDLPGALSVIIDGNCFWYPQLTTGILLKYNIHAGFGVNAHTLRSEPADITDHSGYREKRMGPEQIATLKDRGHEAVYIPWNRDETPEDKARLEQLTEALLPFAVIPEGVIVSRDLKKSFDHVIQAPEEAYWLSSPEETDIKAYDEYLSGRRGKRTTVFFRRIDLKAGNDTSFSLTEFERYLRLSRNHGYWMATPSQVQRYLDSRDAVSLQTESMGNTSFLRANLRRPLANPHPISIIFRTTGSKVRVSNSLSDGIHEIRNGVIMFDMMPGSQVIIENLLP